jgi:hypothetical protein
MSESSFNSTFRRNLLTVGRIRIHRIESHSTAPGIPDNHFISLSTGITGWIEMKEAGPKEVSPSRIDYRPAQVPWLLEYDKDGGRCYTGIHIPRINLFLLIPGRYSRLASIDLRRTPLWTFGFQEGCDWRRLAEVLQAPLLQSPPGLLGEVGEPKEIGSSPFRKNGAGSRTG